MAPGRFDPAVAVAVAADAYLLPIPTRVGKVSTAMSAFLIRLDGSRNAIVNGELAVRNSLMVSQGSITDFVGNFILSVIDTD